MREVTVSARVDSFTADEAYALVSRFKDYPEHSDAILGVSVEPADGGEDCSVTWQVRFREGVLCWTEKDRLDPESRTIVFDRTEGDVAAFFGEWRVVEEPGAAWVEFEASFDLGIPALNAYLEPVAEQILVENIQSLIKGFFGDAAQLSPVPH